MRAVDDLRPRPDFCRVLRTVRSGSEILRKVAWEVADQLGGASTYDAEFIALTERQADALRRP